MYWGVFPTADGALICGHFSRLGGWRDGAQEAEGSGQSAVGTKRRKRGGGCERQSDHWFDPWMAESVGGRQ